MTYEQAPQAPPGSYQSGPSGPRAGFGRRLLAFIVDFLVLLIPSAIVLAVFGRNAGGQGIQTLISLAYFTYFEGGPTGATLGKRALGIRVYDLRQGGPIGYGRGLIRWLGRIVSGFVCYLGYFWMLWDREKQCWHDKIATTVVVPVSSYPVR